MPRIALFPLNTVLYPHMPLTLHIFEERYKLMIKRCIERNEPFGVVLIREGQEVGIAADPYLVGCTARITQVQPVGLGRMNIVAIGESAFRIDRLDHSEPYLCADVTLLPSAEAAALPPTETQKLRGWLERYLQLIARSENVEIDFNQLPAEGVNLMYLSASLIRIPMAEKQALLETGDAASIVRTLYEQMRKEVTLMKIVSAYTGAGERAFSAN
jgi:Lon protease-like protein